MKVDACLKLLGKNFNFYVGQERKEGRLLSVGIDYNEKLVVRISNNDGFTDEYAIDDIRVENTEFKKNNLVKQIIKNISNKMDSFKYDLREYYKDCIENILNEITDVHKANRINNYLKTNERFDSYEAVYQDICESVDSDNSELVCGLVAYNLHDNDTAYRIFRQRWLCDESNPDFCRDLILIADAFDNDVLCFYLLNRFFSTNEINDGCNLNLWWKYLFYAVKYNNFDLLESIRITDLNVRTMIDSFIYIFHMYNLEHMAERLTMCFANGNNMILQKNNEDLGDLKETINELNLCRNYLPNTADGYYTRFVDCMENILNLYHNHKLYNIPDNERNGYVYEYVKSRNYGFIIGFDFQKYFYHSDDLSSDMLRKRIINRIYSTKDTGEDDQIYVQFECERINRRVQAANII